MYPVPLHISCKSIYSYVNIIFLRRNRSRTQNRYILPIITFLYEISCEIIFKISMKNISAKDIYTFYRKSKNVVRNIIIKKEFFRCFLKNLIFFILQSYNIFTHLIFSYISISQLKLFSAVRCNIDCSVYLNEYF